jgi:hypothetical protein
MRALGYPFCQVPSQEMVLRLYLGGWGVPEAGISLIEPGTTQPESASLTLDYPATLTFSAEILSPVSGPPVEITWLDNGVPIPEATTDTLVYTTPVNSPGLHTITLRVEDVTSLVHPLMAGDALLQEYTWEVEIVQPVLAVVSADPLAILADGFSTTTITVTVTENGEPYAGQEITFSTTLGSIDPLLATTDDTGTATAILTSGLESGTAIVTVAAPSFSTAVEVQFLPLPRVLIPILLKPAEG